MGALEMVATVLAQGPRVGGGQRPTNMAPVAGQIEPRAAGRPADRALALRAGARGGMPDPKQADRQHWRTERAGEIGLQRAGVPGLWRQRTLSAEAIAVARGFEWPAEEPQTVTHVPDRQVQPPQLRVPLPVPAARQLLDRAVKIGSERLADAQIEPEPRQRALEARIDGPARLPLRLGV